MLLFKGFGTHPWSLDRSSTGSVINAWNIIFISVTGQHKNSSVSLQNPWAVRSPLCRQTDWDWDSLVSTERLEPVSEVIASSLIAVSPGLLHSPLCLVHGEARRAPRPVLCCTEEHRVMADPEAAEPGAPSQLTRFRTKDLERQIATVGSMLFRSCALCVGRVRALLSTVVTLTCAHWALLGQRACSFPLPSQCTWHPYKIK